MSRSQRWKRLQCIIGEPQSLFSILKKSEAQYKRKNNTLIDWLIDWLMECLITTQTLQGHIALSATPSLNSLHSQRLSRLIHCTPCDSVAFACAWKSKYKNSKGGIFAPNYATDIDARRTDWCNIQQARHTVWQNWVAMTNRTGITWKGRGRQISTTIDDEEE